MKKLLLLLGLSVLFFSCSEPDPPEQEISTDKYELGFSSVCTAETVSADIWYFEVTKDFFGSFTRNNTPHDCTVTFSVEDIHGNKHEGYYRGNKTTISPGN